ncbi:hypothetical protein E0H75_19005 [Kribbella capetownensis]|uniref:Uncharacterized protein n=1 Tax=Kribbella capetownensis TaxID=1572659 RepID=A0A4R0JU43_9ACTN|nr:DUF6069 family protein [Kribbella capetownensis]TCC48676.1 hypothetical protein E0H75_19005 [Kribbella capetownensis]
MATTPYPTAPESVAEPRPTRVPGRSRLLVVGVTAAAALALWAILAPLAGITLDAQQGTLMHIGAGQVFFASAAMAFAAWGLLAILERRTFNARNVWTVVAVIACVLSLGSPLVNGIGVGAKLGLASLHLVVGAAVILGLRRTTLTAQERC